jgi:hypothetical protein
VTFAERVEIAVAATNGLVALGTGFLAWKTNRVARATDSEAKAVGKQADASEKQIELTRAALQASIQPWLTTVPRPPRRSIAYGLGPNAAIGVSPGEETHRVYIRYPEPDEIEISLFLRNVGRGVALIKPLDGCVIEGLGANDEPVTRYGFLSASALPPDDMTRVGFRVQRVDVGRFLSAHRNNGEFWVSVLYTDVRDEQAVRARIHVTAAARDSEEWLFHLIEYRREGEAEPFATVQFDAALLSMG